MFGAYQSTQGERLEKAFTKASHAVSLVAQASGRAIFVGVYERGAYRDVDYDEFWAMPEHQELRRLGYIGFQGDRPTCLWFELDPVQALSEWSGRLEVEWPGGERSWWRWSGRNSIPVYAVHEESVLVPRPPNADALSLSWAELQSLPQSWSYAIRQSRGIYLIVDRADGKAYVGSAHGADNIYGRWMAYADTGHGGNAQLRHRNPREFVFSALELVAQNASESEVIALEQRWKDRLMTRVFGLNSN